MKIWSLMALIAGLAGLQALLYYQAWYDPERGLRALHAVTAEVAAHRLENQRLEARNAILRADIEGLKASTEALEERARVELGLIRPDETFYRLLPPGESVAYAPLAPSKP